MGGAMNSFSVFDDVTFARYLLDNRIVKPGSEKFFVHWV